MIISSPQSYDVEYLVFPDGCQKYVKDLWWIRRLVTLWPLFLSSGGDGDMDDPKLWTESVTGPGRNQGLICDPWNYNRWRSSTHPPRVRSSTTEELKGILLVYGGRVGGVKLEVGGGEWSITEKGTLLPRSTTDDLGFPRVVCSVRWVCLTTLRPQKREQYVHGCIIGAKMENRILNRIYKLNL